MIASPLNRLFTIVITIFLLCSAQALSSAEIGHILLDNYDDGSEMNQKIILDFMTSEKCQQKCSGYVKSNLLNDFQSFRGEWVDRMINYVISELGIDAQSARHVRKNPANYKINYQTFKLLDFK